MQANPDPHPQKPLVSILIPNFNNGATASKNGRRNFIADLLKSLERTLKNEITPFEILVFDDGSTDDSIETLRTWANEKTWPDARPFLKLTEAPHCGILSITANKLYREAVGEILIRLDGDIICLTPNWVSAIYQTFQNAPPDLGIVGPKQLGVGFRIHSMGDFLLHPNGYHHVGFGLPRYQIRRALEVDHVMGCFYSCRRQVYEDIGGFDEKMLRGQTVDFGLKARLLGWRCWAVPDVEFIHAHSERADRSTTADSAEGVMASVDYFEKKWGFSRIAPDLDVVRERYRGTPLLWNPQWFDNTSFNNSRALWERAWPAPARTLNADNSEWGLFANDSAFKQKTMLRARSIVDVIRQTGPKGLVAHLCCGCGLLGHILAQAGLNYLGLDIHARHVELARTLCGKQKYSNTVTQPQFEIITQARELPLADDSIDLFAVTDQLERHPNPTGLLKEIRRVLRPEGFLVIVSEEHPAIASTIMQEEHWYRLPEMINQVKSVSNLIIVSNTAAQNAPDHLLLAAQYLPDGLPETAPLQQAADTGTSLTRTV